MNYFDNYCKSEIFARIYLQETLHLRSLVKTKSSRNSKITLAFTVIGKSCPCRYNLTLKICLLTLFAKIKFLRKLSDLQYL